LRVTIPSSLFAGRGLLIDHFEFGILGDFVIVFAAVFRFFFNVARLLLLLLLARLGCKSSGVCARAYVHIEYFVVVFLFRDEFEAAIAATATRCLAIETRPSISRAGRVGVLS
jgi:hypothetical protein